MYFIPLAKWHAEFAFYNTYLPFTCHTAANVIFCFHADKAKIKRNNLIFVAVVVAAAVVVSFGKIRM